MRNERVEDISDEVHGRRLFGVVVGKRQAKFEDGIGVVALTPEMNLAIQGDSV